MIDSYRVQKFERKSLSPRFQQTKQSAALIYVCIKYLTSKDFAWSI